MTASEVFAEPTPRSPSTIAHYRDHVAQVARRFTKRVALGFGAFAGLVVLLIGSAMMSTDPELDLEKAFGGVIGLGLLLVALPAWVVGKLAMRDAKTAARLVRDGTAYRAAVVRRVVVPGMIPYAVLAWNEGELRVAARFALTDAVVLADPDEIIVLARPKKHAVAAIFGDRTIQLGGRTRLRKKELQ